MIEVDRDRNRGREEGIEGPAGSPGLRERHKRDKHRRIVAAAAGLFAERGFEGTTAREVSRRAGIGTGTLFSYVRDKRELLLLVFREDAERLLAAPPPALGRDEGVVDALVAVFAPFVALYARREALAALFVRELFFRREEETRGLAALDRALVARVRALLAQAAERGELRAELDLGAATRVVLAAYGLWIQGWLGGGHWGADAVLPGLRADLALVVRGLAAREETS
jgi:AcrR family transcriptional regulator